MIEVRDIHKKYRRRKVLDGVSFQIEKGEITCLIGTNGAGKSTVMKAIMGLTPIRKGEIIMDGQKLGKERYEKISFIPDHLTMPPAMKLDEAMVFMADFYRSWNEERAKELMSFFQLEGKERIGHLSKGTAAKFNLLLGLALDTEYVLMDEPFSGIDMFSRALITEVFSSHLIEDRGVLITTHEIADVEHLIDRAVLLQNGAVCRDFYCEQLRMEEAKSIVDVMKEVYQA
ncbi:ABC transporter ATP-binding protein [Paenibacillus sp. FSL H8-0537]|uniref:ABC transporter ATP-binding protein n=1 Tax=Paenibacillus sp. FSL H8-0537 TaxID=2921399 RepID=UPI0031011608